MAALHSSQIPEQKNVKNKSLSNPNPDKLHWNTKNKELTLADF